MRPRIDDLRTIQQLALTYKWSLEFTKFPSGVATSIDSNFLNMMCETANIPKETPSIITINQRGARVNYPGITNASGNISLTFIETVDQSVMKFLTAWRKACYDAKTGLSLTKGEVEAIITLYLLDNQNSPTYKYKLVGCILEDYTPSTLSNEADFMKPSITVHYDYFEEA